MPKMSASRSGKPSFVKPSPETCDMPNEWEFLKSFLEKNPEREVSPRVFLSHAYGSGKSHFISHLLNSGLGQQMVELLPTLALLCIFRVSEIAEREQRAVADFNSTD